MHRYPGIRVENHTPYIARLLELARSFNPEAEKEVMI